MSLAELIDKRFGVKTRPVENPEDVTTASTTAQQILGNNPNRLAFVVQNLGSTVCYLGLTSGVSTTKGIRLDANGGVVSMVMEEDFQLVGWEWWIISASGTPAVYSLEVVEY